MLRLTSEYAFRLIQLFYSALNSPIQWSRDLQLFHCCGNARVLLLRDYDRICEKKPHFPEDVFRNFEIHAKKRSWEAPAKLREYFKHCAVSPRSLRNSISLALGSWLTNRTKFRDAHAIRKCVLPWYGRTLYAFFLSMAAWGRVRTQLSTVDAKMERILTKRNKFYIISSNIWGCELRNFPSVNAVRERPIGRCFVNILHPCICPERLPSKQWPTQVGWPRELIYIRV